MNYLYSELLAKANRETIYNLYLYLVDKVPSFINDSLYKVTNKLELASKEKSYEWGKRDYLRLKILRNAVNNNYDLAYSKINNLTYSEKGLTACTFERDNKDVSVIFKGTGSGEWIDNGEGLSGIPEENTYLTFLPSGEVAYSYTQTKDYATDQQVQALNWFNSIAAKNGWDNSTHITVSGHSKGGNKAQFIAVHSSLVDECYSFGGQGFSPEFLFALQQRYGNEYNKRRQKIYSFSTENDYVNVLGERLVPENNIYYLKSGAGIHNIEAIIDINGRLNLQSEQGKLSLYVEKISDDLMSMTPYLRRYATLGIMNIFQRYLGEGEAVNGDWVSKEETIAGIIIAVGSFLRNLPKFE